MKPHPSPKFQATGLDTVLSFKLSDSSLYTDSLFCECKYTCVYSVYLQSIYTHITECIELFLQSDLSSDP